MQIESLWTFNEKFQPEWHPRYACYDSPEHLLAASIAVARAESFWELPVIGRFFGPRGSDGDGEVRPRQLPVVDDDPPPVPAAPRTGIGREPVVATPAPERPGLPDSAAAGSGSGDAEDLEVLTVEEERGGVVPARRAAVGRCHRVGAGDGVSALLDRRRSRPRPGSGRRSTVHGRPRRRAVGTGTGDSRVACTTASTARVGEHRPAVRTAARSRPAGDARPRNPVLKVTFAKPSRSRSSSPAPMPPL